MSLRSPLSRSSPRRFTRNFEKTFKRWNFTVLPRMFNDTPISWFESRLFPDSMIGWLTL
jgi:hypothetical protein